MSTSSNHETDVTLVPQDSRMHGYICIKLSWAILRPIQPRHSCARHCARLTTFRDLANSVSLHSIISGPTYIPLCTLGMFFRVFTYCSLSDVCSTSNEEISFRDITFEPTYGIRTQCLVACSLEGLKA